MRKKMKKVISLGVLAFGLVLLSGCGTSNEGPKQNSLPTQKNQPEQKPKDASQNAPDMKNTNLNNNNSAAGADSEESLLSQEEAEAKDALPSDQEVDDLSNTYDENSIQ